jgi:glycerol-3-phosphate dehydrogenase
MATEECYDVLVIGGGVVGLSVLRSATLAGWKCVLVEAEADILSCASGSNSGIACTGVDASPGTLERALIRDSISLIRPFCEQHNIPYRPCGSLVCHWPWDEGDRLDEVLAASFDAGDTHAKRLQPHQVRELEPNLTGSCKGAVYIPGEIVLDPWLFSVAFAAHARENGANIVTNFRFQPQESSWDTEKQLWNVVRDQCSNGFLEDEIPKSFKARSIVNATGILADLVQEGTPDMSPPHWKARPRRGQYRIFASSDATRIVHPIQPVPTQRTKGIFVFSTLYDQIVCGPTALDQESRFDCCADPKVAMELTKYAMQVLPDLRPKDQYVGEYCGIRPGTDLGDYQVKLFPERHWISAAGIRSTGLTASLGIGRHVSHLLHMILPLPPTPVSMQLTPLPAVCDLVKNYTARSDGTVEINNILYRVTHPLTRLGWDAQTGIAQASFRATVDQQSTRKSTSKMPIASNSSNSSGLPSGSVQNGFEK